MNPSEFNALRSMVQQDEGLRLKPYVDTVGKITIGYGRNLTDVGISEAEADEMLTRDLETTVARLTLVHPDVLSLDPVRQIALANMAFNLGVEGIGAFHQMWDAIDRQDWTAAALAMLDSVWARQVGARAQRLAALIRTGAM